MTTNRNPFRQPILSHRQVVQKIKRIAFEVLERNFYEKHLWIAGVEGMGYTIAKMLKDELRQISLLDVHLVKIFINKNSPSLQEVSLDVRTADLDGKVVVVVDDVLNTGRTLAYSMKPFFGVKISRLQVAVLVDRNHRNFPVAADYVGYALSTTINQHISVEMNEAGEMAVYLD
ncbi:MAG: phosphoribosyltransferase family protein [Flammeovirgaceae bacterium]|nr:phosphoribosyltransferase family protein [Flammeovirgaceae bacterium]MDW8288872.1 phosphoribosyltransferase family protein [Flammeovirgaceae bacterium]